MSRIVKDHLHGYKRRFFLDKHKKGGYHKIVMRIILLFLSLFCLAPLNGFAQSTKKQGKMILIPKEKRGSESPIRLTLFFSKNLDLGMLMYGATLDKRKEYVAVSAEVAKSSGEKYYKKSDGTYEIYTTVKKIVKDPAKQIFLVGYKGNPLATDEMVKLLVKRIGVYEQPGGSTLTAYKVETE